MLQDACGSTRFSRSGSVIDGGKACIFSIFEYALTMGFLYGKGIVADATATNARGEVQIIKRSYRSVTALLLQVTIPFSFCSKLL